MCQLPRCYSRWLLCSEGCLSGETVCACMCVCVHVCVWPCVPLLSAVILPASGFDKDQHCGGKWISSCLHFVSACMLRFAHLCSHRCLFMMSVFTHYMCIFMFVCISVCAKNSNKLRHINDSNFAWCAKKWLTHIQLKTCKNGDQHKRDQNRWNNCGQKDVQDRNHSVFS